MIPYYVEQSGKAVFTITNRDGVIVRTMDERADTGRNMLTFPQFVRSGDDVCTLTMTVGGKEYKLPIRLH